MINGTPPQLAGAGAWSCSLYPFPVWGQNVDWTADGRPDENKAHNCLPESVAMCLKHLTGIELPADFIKDVEYGEGYTGDTDFNHAQSFLTRHCDTRSHQWSASGNSDTLWHVWNGLHRGFPVIGLFRYGGTPTGYPHCCPYIYLDATTVKVVDPWDAIIRSWTYDEHAAWSANYGLTLQRARLY